MKRVLSGIQPTGNLHLGNYLGAIRQWVDDYQKEYECLFCIVDLHAITVPQDPKSLLESTYYSAAAYIASGIDPQKSFIFPQSQIAAHSELAWLLSCMTPLGWLNRMTQFKEKSGKHKDRACLGLYAYPVLMAADILLYNTTHVPVGEDQKQHIELARDIALSVNSNFGGDVFVVPEPKIKEQGARIMSLRDGSSKMSKSDESEYSRINLCDDNDTIALKIKKAKTDPDPLPETKEGLEARPEAKNLVTIHATLKGQSVEEVLSMHHGENFSTFKQQLTEAMVETLSPIREKIAEMMQDKAMLDQVLKAGTEKAAGIAEETLSKVKRTFGFLTF